MIRGSMILLAFVGPIALYCGWQAWSVSRVDLLIPDPPPDKSAEVAQLGSTRTKADRLSGEVRKAAAVALQYRAAGPDDATSDSDTAAVTRAAAKRSAELNDLEMFLSGADDPVFAGSLRSKYLEWQLSRSEMAKVEKVIEEWFAAPAPPIATPAEAAKIVSVVERLIAAYAQEQRFSDPVKIASWKARLRVEIVEALGAAAEAPYRRAMNLPLPLPSASENEDVRLAAAAPRALRDHVKLLQEELTQAEESKLEVPGRVLASARAAARRADEWAARERLLALFREPTLFSRADGAAAWLERVNTEFDRSATTEERALIRRKVQEFCEAFIPTTVRLDDTVLLDGKRVPRTQVEVKYFPASGGGSVRAKLTADPERSALSEFTVAQKHPGDDTLIVRGAAEHYPKELKPTALSEAAVAFVEARRAAGAAGGSLKWTERTIARLKSLCIPHAAELDKLKVSADKLEPAPQIATRIDSLAKGADTYRQLFETGQ